MEPWRTFQRYFRRNPRLRTDHCSIDYDERSKSHIKPVMVLSKFPMDTSFQITPIEGYLNLTESDLESEGFWDEKKDNRMFWRGSTTGGWNTQYRDWRDSHRIRLHLKINGKKGDTSWEENESEIMVPDGLGGYAMKRRKDGVLSMAYADVKLSGQAMQVSYPGLLTDFQLRSER